MNFLKRALTSIFRTPLKSSFLFMLIFILGTVTSGAISVRNAIHATDLNLRRNMRPVVVISEIWTFLPDINDDLLEEIDSDFFILDALYEVGNLPYVEYFDYFMQIQMLSTDLEIWYPTTRQDISSLRGMPDPDLGEAFDIRGVSHPEFVDMRQGFVEIVEGVTFTDEQIIYGELVTVVSRDLAISNGLAVGDRIRLNTQGLNVDADGNFLFGHLDAYEFEIIGLFDVIGLSEVEFGNVGSWTLSELNKFNFANQIYLPNRIVKYANESLNYQSSRVDEFLGAEIDWENWEEFYRINPIFVLHDPFYLDDFRTAAQSILGNMWYLSDGVNRFAPISNSMILMRELADNLLFFVSIATLIVLGLLITLFLHDRRHEIGIYLALGERRIKVLGQVFTEVFLLAIFAITISLFVGSFVANHMSQELLLNDLANIETPVRTVFSPEPLEPWERMGFPSPMSGEEMLEFFDFSIDGVTILLFYIISLAVLGASTIFPILYLTQLNPKKVLL